MLSTDEASRSNAASPMAKAMDYAERAEYLYIAPGQATVRALLALFWLKGAKLEAHGIVQPDDAEAEPSTDK